MSLPEILTLEEVAQYLRVNNKTVYRLAKDGKLPAFKVGRNWRFHRADVERYITYKYHIFGTVGVRSDFYKAEVLQRYLNDSQKYYIFDEAFSGTLGLREFYYDWKKGKVQEKNQFVDLSYKKVRLNLASPGEPVKWALLVVLTPEQAQKLQSIPEEYNHWRKYWVHYLTLPNSEIV